MNRRQRRGVVLIAVAVIGAAAAFVSVANYVAEVERQVGPLTTVIRLIQDAPPYQEVTQDMVEQVEVPVRWRPANALASTLELEGRVPTVTLPAGTLLQQGLLVDPPQLREGQREVAIMVDAETGVAGKINRGSVVDIYATFAQSDLAGAHVSIVVENAQIIDVGTRTTTSETDATGGFSQGEVVPVTFALTVEESLRLTYIESFASNVRLVLRAPNDDERSRPSRRVYEPDGPVIGDAGEGTGADE